MVTIIGLFHPYFNIVMFHPYHWWRLGPTLDRIPSKILHPRNLTDNKNSHILSQRPALPFRPHHFGARARRSFFGGNIFPSPTMGFQERFDEICEKYELRDGDAAGEVGVCGWGSSDFVVP